MQVAANRESLEEHRSLQAEKYKEFVGSSEPIRRLKAFTRKIAPLDSTVLITGESGTGKELIADMIHDQSPRALGPLVKINCAAIPETLLEGEIFGHEKGAFTGAYSRRLGKFEKSQKGTILLDEIGDMPYGIQGKLLRLIEDKKVERLGGNVPLSVDARVIAATNQDLVDLIHQNRFREDLFYRLNVVSIHVPALRERMEDLPLLVDHLLNKINVRLGIALSGVSQKAMELLLSYHWPGNVRELANVLERAAILSESNVLNAEDVQMALERRHDPCSPRGQILDCPSDANGRILSLTETLQLMEKNLITSALVKSGGIQTQAAKMLGVSPKNLWKKIKKHAIDTRVWANPCNELLRSGRSNKTLDLDTTHQGNSLPCESVMSAY